MAKGARLGTGVIMAADPRSPGYGFFYVTCTSDQNDRLYFMLSRYRLDFNRLDNHLFLGVGDDTDVKQAQDERSLKGKVLRLAVDDVPADLVGNAEGRAARRDVGDGLSQPMEARQRHVHHDCRRGRGAGAGDRLHPGDRADHLPRRRQRRSPLRRQWE